MLARSSALLLGLAACRSLPAPPDPLAADDVVYRVDATAEPHTRNERAPEGPAIGWVRSWSAATRRAKVEHRLILVWVHADWSVASQRLEREVWSDGRVRAAAQAMVPLVLDVSAARAEDESALAPLGVESIPAIRIVDEQRRERGRVDGTMDVERVIAVLRAVAAAN